VHDIGKVRVPREILEKPAPLSEAEWDVVRRHPVWGVELLAELASPWDIGPMVRWHHERVDGTGYPDGLRGDQIPLGAQVIAIADVYDALTTARSYRPAMTPDRAVLTITTSAGQWRPDVLDAFMGSVARSAAAA
jgi:HD-GYP domain-containing protein (c-di-GMP phosphodiesterase class II)